MDEKSRVIKLKEVKKSKLFTLLIKIKSGYQYRHDRSIDCYIFCNTPEKFCWWNNCLLVKAYNMQKDRQTDRKTGTLTKKFHS